MKKYYIAILLFSVFFQSCFTPQKMMKIMADNDSVRKVQFKEMKITPKKNYEALGVNKQVDIIHADLKVSFNWGKHELNGTEIIKLKPYYYETDSIELDAKNMTFTNVLVQTMALDTIQHLVDYNQKKLKIYLEKKIKSSDTILVTLQYIAKPDDNEKGSDDAIRDDKGLFFINTQNKEPYKPVQIWTQGETESNSCWFPTIDKPYEKFTSTITITTNKDLTILSNGEKVSSLIDGNTKTEKWANEKPMSAYLTMMAIGNFVVEKDTLNNKEISYYLEPAYAPFAKNIFKNTKEMISFYGQKLGVEYPWNKYAQVVVRDYVSGAMENTSATLHGEFVQKNNRELIDANNDDIIAHELFHQWFGDLVTCKNWSQITLNEGFATYGEHLWNEYKYGNDVTLMKTMQRTQKYINYVKKNPDNPIIYNLYKSPDDMFTSIVYQKGGSVLHLLRNEIGEDAFFLGIKNYLQLFKYDNVDIDDLRKCFEKVCGRDLTFFFNQWYLKAGHPNLNIRYNYIDSTQLVEVIVEQTQAPEVGLYKFPLTFKITQGNKKRQFTFQIEKKKETYFVQKIDFEDAFYPNIIVDPYATFIGEITDNKPFFYQIKTYNEAQNYVEKYRSLKALSEIQNVNDTARLTLLTALNDVNEDIRLQTLNWIDWKNAKNIQATKEQLFYMAKNDSKSLIRAKAVEIVGALKDPLNINTFFDLAHDSSYTVAGNALHVIFAIIPEEGIRTAKELQQDAKGNLFEEISSIFSKTKDTSLLAFYQTNLMKVFGRQRANLLDDFAQFAQNNNQPYCYTTVTDVLYKRALEDENVFVRYTAINDLNEINNFYTIQQKQNISADEKNNLTIESNLLQEKIKSIIAQEQDEYVLELLKLKGLYSGIKQ